MVEIIPDLTTTPQSVASLGAATAKIVAATHATGLLQSFLMKKVAYSCTLKGGVADELLLVGMARGDATVTQIKAALELAQVERDAKSQAIARDVLFETIRVITGTAGQTHNVIHDMVSLGGGQRNTFRGWRWLAMVRI